MSSLVRSLLKKMRVTIGVVAVGGVGPAERMRNWQQVECHPHRQRKRQAAGHRRRHRLQTKKKQREVESERGRVLGENSIQLIVLHGYIPGRNSAAREIQSLTV